MASLSWTDPEGEYINRGDMNNPTPALRNDLDIRISKDGKTFLPWKLNPRQAAAAAVQGDNLVDPYERIQIPKAKGEYTIHISHKSALQNGIQDFSLVVSGIQFSNCSVAVPQDVGIAAVDSVETKISWSETEDTLFEVQYRQKNANAWTTAHVWESHTLSLIHI